MSEPLHETICELVRGGKSYEATARTLGLSRSTVRDIAVKCGIVGGGRGLRRPQTIATVKLARLLWDMGLKVSEIAPRLEAQTGRKFTKHAVAGIAYRNGFPKRQGRKQ